MSEIVLFRIDERLVHGQIVTAWLGHTQVNKIIVIDDSVASDSFMGSILKMAVPPQVAVDILTVAQSVQLAAEDDRGERLMIVVKTPEAARKVLMNQLAVQEINLGNSGMAGKRVKLTDSVYLDENGIQEVNKIVELGYPVYCQTTPSTKRQEWKNILAERERGKKHC